MKNSGFQSVFKQIYDVVIFGSGYAGFAAAMKCADAGKKVILVNSLPILLWESSYAFNNFCDTKKSAEFGVFLDLLKKRARASNGFIESAGAEIIATYELCRKSVDLLYYAFPIGVAKDNNFVTAVTVATKSGIRSIHGKSWIDCTEEASLATKINPEINTLKNPHEYKLFAHYRNLGWDAYTFEGNEEIFSSKSRAGRILKTPDTKNICMEVTVRDNSSPVKNLIASMKDFKEALPGRMKGGILILLRCLRWNK